MEVSKSIMEGFPGQMLKSEVLNLNKRPQLYTRIIDGPVSSSAAYSEYRKYLFPLELEQTLQNILNHLFINCEVHEKP